MPGTNGEETIGERLTRLRTQLARAEKTIERAENNGQSFSIRGTTVTQIAYERALDRARRLRGEIAALEARLRGERRGVTEIQTRLS